MPFGGTPDNRNQLVERPVTRTSPRLEPLVPNSGKRLKTKPFT
jgi:hypothetical protein